MYLVIEIFTSVFHLDAPKLDSHPTTSSLEDVRHHSDLLPALKGEGSLRAVHWFAVYKTGG
ncbi:MAG: hypothetical protein OWQ55_02925 [Sulfuracidifex metallicus]|nr:hypothetical protein [Sulfuracidifex metallicus]